jgi:ribosomal protein S16
VAGYCEPSSSVRDGQFIDQLSVYQPFKKKRTVAQSV